MTSTPKIIFAMVGKPARGKTHIARKITRYLNWRGRSAKWFNVGNYRRKLLGASQPAAFFDPTNPDGVKARKKMAIAALQDLEQWMIEGGEVAIYDATNSTRKRRELLRKFAETHQFQLIFIESMCTDSDIVEANIRETKVSSPDYRGMGEDEAVTDFRKRLAFYAAGYEPLEENEGSWVKIIDVGRQVITNEITGYLPSRLVFFLMNLHISPRTIWLTRHGQSEYNVLGRIGGDSPLSPAGQEFSNALSAYVAQLPEPPTFVWTSTLRRTIQTASSLSLPKRALKELDEINAGICDGMTYAEIERIYPLEFSSRKQDKFRYRYPQGESYQDVIKRLDPIIIEIERTREPLLIVAHQAILRALYAYLMEQNAEACPHLSMPLHSVIQLQPKTYGCSESVAALSSPSPSGNSS